MAFTGQSHTYGRVVMPILLWFLGVPLGLVILLMLFGVVSF